jgi:hypothetical protein
MKAKAKLSSAQIKALATHLGGKPLTRKTQFPKTPAKSLAPVGPGMDAEDKLDGGIDEATEDKKY